LDGYLWSWWVAVALSGFTIIRLHGIFGSHKSAGAGGSGADRIVPFNPKRVLYEGHGPSGTVGSISYLDENAQPQRADSPHCRGPFK
jgi:hypothetical protein